MKNENYKIDWRDSIVTKVCASLMTLMAVVGAGFFVDYCGKRSFEETNQKYGFLREYSEDFQREFLESDMERQYPWLPKCTNGYAAHLIFNQLGR